MRVFFVANREFLTINFTCTYIYSAHTTSLEKIDRNFGTGRLDKCDYCSPVHIIAYIHSGYSFGWDFVPAMVAGVILGITVYSSRRKKVRIQLSQEETPTEVKPKSKRPSESNLDDLIKEIEDFINRWKVGSGLKSSYRWCIETRRMSRQRKKVKEHSREIRRKTNNLRGFRGSKPTLDSLEIIVNKMLDFGQEIEFTFPSRMRRGERLKIEQSKLNSLVSKGDSICDELSDIKLQLEKLG